MCVCVCVCVSVGARVCMCVCILVIQSDSVESVILLFECLTKFTGLCCPVCVFVTCLPGAMFGRCCLFVEFIPLSTQTDR